MHLLTSNQVPSVSISHGGGGAIHSVNPRNTGYAERRDEQHALVWDQESPRMTFAEVPSAEELALIRLFEVARRHEQAADSKSQRETDFSTQVLKTPVTQPKGQDVQEQRHVLQSPNSQNPSSQNPSALDLNVFYDACLEAIFPAPPADSGALKDVQMQTGRLDFSPAPFNFHGESQPVSNFKRRPLSAKESTELAESLIDLVGTETLRHVSSYEKLLRNTSYRVLEGNVGNLKDMPVSDSKTIDASLLKIVDSADRVSAHQYSQYLSTSAFRCQAFLSLGVKSADAAWEVKKLRGVDEHPIARLLSFDCSEVRDVLSNLWNRVVAKKNASLSLAIMRRKMRVR